MTQQREKYKTEWNAPKPFICLECGELHQPKFGDKRDKYCSDKCMNKNINRNQHHIRRCKIKTQFKDKVYKIRIFKRDNFRCQICGKKVAMNKKAPSPYSPSIDHIIPLVKGGTHEPKNVRLVHFICNSIKSANISKHGDQLYLFG